jgi:hypothetical protein
MKNMTRGNEIIEQLTSLEEAYEQNRLELVNALREEFSSLFIPLFEKSKLIESISWVQYTDYFNDGDACNFHANTEEIYINDEYEYELDWYSWRVDSSSNNEIGPEVNIEESRIVNEIKTLINKFSYETLEELFGDHKMITLKKDGTLVVNSYTNHD